MRQFFSIAILFGCALSNYLYADIQVSPIYLRLDAHHRMARLAVKHIGREQESYKVSLIFFRMNSEGSLSLASHPTPAERSAISFIRFSPKQVVLTPNVEQVLRVMIVPPKNLPAGDYRAHIQIEPSTASNRSAPEANEKNNQIQLPLKISVAIPLIYQQGESQCSISLGKPQLMKQPDKSLTIEATLAYIGNCFPYGDLYTFFQPSDQEHSVQIGLTKGISSYVANRILRFPLEVPSRLSLRDGSLKIEFRNSKENGGQVLASAENILLAGSE